ncbi:MAG: hypothetical protein ACRD6B_25640, partial [Bryobacteraceae bacterium]
YIDNLELADHILGRIRRLLEQTGDWNRSTILVSSDHPFLKLPGQKTGVEYHREFNSVLSANLLLAALQGKIRTPAQAVQWLNVHAAASEEKVCR